MAIVSPTGKYLVDAVAARLGQTEASEDKVPSASQILEFINTSLVEIVAEHGENMYNFIVMKSIVYGGAEDIDDVLRVIFVAVQAATSAPILSCRQVPVDEYYTMVFQGGNTQSDKGVWTWTPTLPADTPEYVDGVKVLTYPTVGAGGMKMVVFVQVPPPYEYDETRPEREIPFIYIPELINRATALAKLGEQDTEAYGLITGKLGGAR